MLPISVAFIIGGYSGSLLGHEGFFWAGAIGWGTIIAIIDYNFTIIKHGLGFMGTTGRIILIITSAIITSTVGDHIILEDTVKRKKQEHFQAKIDSLKAKPLNPIVRQGIDNDIARASEQVKNQMAVIKSRTDEQIDECRTGVGPRCAFITEQILPAENETLNRLEKTLQELTSERDGALEVAKEKRKEEIAVIVKQSKGHDIILEMNLLYTEIFSQTATTIMFFMFAMMVICIETLPLLLKSGITGGESKKREEEEIANANKQQRANHSIILRNNRI